MPDDYDHVFEELRKLEDARRKHSRLSIKGFFIDQGPGLIIGAAGISLVWTVLGLLLGLWGGG